MTEQIPSTLSEYTVVAIARSSARFRTTEGFEFTLASAPGLDGPTRTRMMTRWVDSGHADPLPRELMIEVAGPASSIDAATRMFNSVARMYGALLAFTTNVMVGGVETHIAFDSTAGKETRDFLEVFLPDQTGGVPDGRFVNLELLTSFAKAYFKSPYAKRITRALQQYELALREWFLGGEYLALSRLFAAADALTPTALKRHRAETGLTDEQIACSFGLDTTAREYEWRQLLNARCRLQLVFQGDDQTHRIASQSRNGLQHGSLDLDEVSRYAVASADKTFNYVRQAIIRLLDIPEDIAEKLSHVKVKDVQSTRKIVRARLLNAAVGAVGQDGEPYPLIEWASRVSGVTSDSSLLSIQETNDFTFRVGEGIGVALDRLDIHGRVEDGHVPVDISPLEGATSGPGHPPAARDLLNATMRLVNDVARTGANIEIPFPGVLAFRQFGLGTACYEACKLLLERGQPIEAALMLRSQVVSTARLEQTQASGFGVAVRATADHFDDLLTPGPVSPTDPKKKAAVLAEKVDLLKHAAKAQILVPDKLESVESAPICASLAAEMAMASIAMKAGQGAALMHMKRGETDQHAEFHSATEQDDLSDLIASASVIAQLENLRVAAQLFGWPIDAGQLEKLDRRAKALNETAAGH